MNFAFPRAPGAWLAAITALSLLACASPAATAQEAVVRLVVPAPAGGNLDMTARALAQRLAVLTGEPHVVENRPGANTAIGSEYVARAPADGRVLLYTGSSLVLNAWLQKLAFSPLEELRPVVQVAVGHYVLVVTTASSIASVGELAARAAERRQGLDCAAPPGPMGVACEQLRARLGGRVTTVPYPGIAPAVTALLGGHVDLLFVNVEAVEPLIQAGRLRAIAASSAAAAPGVPLIGQAWPGFLLEGFSGLFVPAGTPPARVRQLNRQVNQVLRDPQFSGFMAETRQQAGGGSPDQFAAQVAEAHRRYGAVIRSLGLER